jgi:DNA polymerase III alpha subunit
MVSHIEFLQACIDFTLLARLRGLVALTCSPGRSPPGADARDGAGPSRRYEELFGQGNYYLELQDHGPPERSRSTSS